MRLFQNLTWYFVKFQLADLKRENEKAQEEAAKYYEKYGLTQGAESVKMICECLQIFAESSHLIRHKNPLCFLDDPCTKIHCGAGRICNVNGDTAECICIPECPEETDPRRKVCTNRNETWNSDCEVHRHRCLCDTKDARCATPKNSHIHIDYYGECKEIEVSYDVYAREWMVENSYGSGYRFPPRAYMREWNNYVCLIRGRIFFLTRGEWKHERENILDLNSIEEYAHECWIMKGKVQTVSFSVG